MNNLADKEVKLVGKFKKILTKMLVDVEDPAYTVFSRP